MLLSVELTVVPIVFRNPSKPTDVIFIYMIIIIIIIFRIPFYHFHSYHFHYPPLLPSDIHAYAYTKMHIYRLKFLSGPQKRYAPTHVLVRYWVLLCRSGRCVYVAETREDEVKEQLFCFSISMGAVRQFAG